ncbi:putative Chemotaxis protein CheR [Candidatus Desulfosporosinus infrequens]|uniref:Putative Chemotaxis protein CheR n=1 Tax=Candidatus Desulfosporosinus infrequens TaxID=2043169 RepID=A0A2U3KUQ6_9FIRM|nr:putative Chemotaxis protein CheR [Candidatus Desulfosporosinus infrequens]
MKVIAYYKNQTKHILVLDACQEEINSEDFFQEIAGVYTNLEIMFIESLILPVRIIEALINLVDQYGQETFKIYTTTESLSQYLFELSIPNIQLHRLSQIRSENDSEALIKFSEEELRDLLTGIYQIHGYDFRNYQLENLRRTISQTMLRETALDFDSFKKKILQDHEVYQRLFLNLSINVTSFFRNPVLFKELREEVLPYLNSFPHLRIWSVGVASGEEAYSLAILLDELNMLEKSIIYATDFNAFVLQKAQNGFYALPPLRQAGENYRKSGGSKRLEEYFHVNPYYARIKPYIKKKVVFFHHNLTSDTIFNEFHLIICKNVLIYFNSQLQENVVNLFKQSLHRNGFLVLGRSENLFNRQDFIKYKAGFNVFKLFNQG